MYTYAIMKLKHVHLSMQTQPKTLGTPSWSCYFGARAIENDSLGGPSRF